MPNPAPMPGRCNAHRRDGTYCANKPHRMDGVGNYRCRFHGGSGEQAWRSTASKERSSLNALKHGFYAKALRSSIKDPADRKLFDAIDRTTKMFTEIALWRLKIVKFQRLLESGQTTIKTGERPDGTVEYVVIEDLIARGQDVLTRLVKAQADMHPDADSGGDLTITIQVAGGTPNEAASLDVPELEADAAPDTGNAETAKPALPTMPKGVTLRRKAPSPLADLESDD